MRKYSLVRKIIISTIFFIALGVVAPVIVFYSLGYRFNKERNVFIHSGSIVLKTTPYAVRILLNGKEMPQSNIDLINRSFNINGLEPGNYNIEVNASGFYSWKKQVEVHSGIATEFWNVVLVPKPADRKTLIEDNLLKYAFSPDKQKIAYFVNKDNYTSLFVRSQDKDILVFRELNNQRFVPIPGELKWSQDSQWLVFSLKRNGKEKIMLTYGGNEFTEAIPMGDAWKAILEPKGEINFYLLDSQNNIYFVVDGTMYVQSLTDVLSWWNSYNNNSNNNNEEKINKENTNKENYMPQKIKEDANEFTLCGDYLCSFNAGNKEIDVFDQKGRLQKNISFPKDYQTTDKYQIFAYSEKEMAILDEKKNLFLWDEYEDKKEGKEGEMKFIFSGVEEAYFSNDGKKLLFATKNETYVYFTQEWEVQPRHFAGDLVVVSHDVSELEKVQWYLDYQNIFIANKDGIKMIELDERGGRNLANFLEAKNLSDFSYDTVEKKLWFIEEEDGGIKKLQEVQFPITQSLFSEFMNSNNNNSQTNITP